MKNLNLINKYNFIDTLENIDSYGFENNTLEVTFSKENMGPFKNLTISYKIENNKIAIKDVKNVQKNSYKEIFSNIEYDKLNNPIEEYDYEKINEIAFKDHFKIKSKTIYVNSDGKLSFHDDLSLPREEPLNGKYSVQVKQINNSYISKTSNKKGTKITIYDKYLNLIKESYIVEEDDYIGLSLIKNYYLIYAVQNGKDLDIYEYDTVKNTNTKAETIDSSLIIRTLRDLTSKAKTYLEGETLLYAKKAKGPFADYFTHNGKTIYLNTKGEISFNKVEDINEKEILMFDNYVSAVHYIDEHYVYIYVNYEKSTLDQIKIYDKNLKSIDNKTLTSSIEPHINTGNIYYSNNKCNDKKESITEIYRYNIKTKKILTAFVINNGSNMCEK